jgi:hypothetical protein
MAPAPRTHEPLAPTGHGHRGPVLSGVLGEVGLNLVTPRRAPHDQSTLAAAASANVIGGTGFDFTRGAAFLDAARAPGPAPPVAAKAGPPATSPESRATF